MNEGKNYVGIVQVVWSGFFLARLLFTGSL
jgi:hypothetical protein